MYIIIVLFTLRQPCWRIDAKDVTEAVMDDQPAKRGRGRPKTGTAQDGAARQAAYERRKQDRARTMATSLHLLAREDPHIVRRLNRPTLEAMRGSLTPTGRARRDVEAWIASLAGQHRH
jgi:hypothetical protein